MGRWLVNIADIESEMVIEGGSDILDLKETGFVTVI